MARSSSAARAACWAIAVCWAVTWPRRAATSDRARSAATRPSRSAASWRCGLGAGGALGLEFLGGAVALGGGTGQRLVALGQGCLADLHLALELAQALLEVGPLGLGAGKLALGGAQRRGQAVAVADQGRGLVADAGKVGLGPSPGVALGHELARQRAQALQLGDQARQQSQVLLQRGR